MRKMKDLFSTTRKAVLSSICALAILLTLGGVTAYAASAITESTAIGSENAQNFAFADAGVDPATAQIARSEFDFEQGQFVYEVDFIANDIKYEYWIKASNGTVLKKEVEILTKEKSNVTATVQITLDQAKETALADAKLSAAEVSFTEGKLDVDHGVPVYEIRFFANHVYYEYEIHAESGTIYSKSKETRMPLAPENENAAPSEPIAAAQDPTASSSFSATTPSDSTQSSQISLDKAKETALSDAGVAASTVMFTKAKLDYDEGIAVYDIEFYTSTHEYEYEIHAKNGTVQERSVEALNGKETTPKANPTEHPSQGQRTPSEYFGLDKAKSIAVEKAGLSVSNVTFKKAKLDTDDGIAVYEIDFYHNGTEYECEINAITGAVLEYDFELDD